jgi:hypothetical protein
MIGAFSSGIQKNRCGCIVGAHQTAAAEFPF